MKIRAGQEFSTKALAFELQFFDWKGIEVHG